MSKISVYIGLTKEQEKQFEHARSLLGRIPEGAPKAISSALNKTVKGIRTDAAKKAADDYVISSGKVMEKTDISKAAPQSLIAGFVAKGRPIRLINFNVNPKQFPRKRPKKRPSSATKRGTSRKVLPYSFIAKVRGDHVGVFSRVPGKTAKTEGKEVLQQRYGPSVPQMLGSSNIKSFVDERARARLGKALDHEIERILKGWGK